MHSRHAEGDPARVAPRPTGGDPRVALGRRGEELAAAHFTRAGFCVLARNVRTRDGEIDLIAFDGRTLVFAEIKTHAARGGRLHSEQHPLWRLRPRQRARVRRLAVAWLGDDRHERPTARAIRFDAVGVIVDERGRLVRLDHVEAAW